MILPISTFDASLQPRVGFSRQEARDTDGTARSVASFAINGRFLSQPVTGVQRYGREILRALDRLAADRGLAIDLLLPCGAEPPADLRACRPRVSGVGRGHAWEQGLLATSPQRLLNLCNTAPLFGRNGVLCIHDANVFEVPDSYTPAFRRFYGMLHPSIARSEARIVTVSHDAARRLSRHLALAESTIAVAVDGHEHALRWQPERAAVRPNERPYVLLIGSIARHKNIDRVLGLAEALDARGLDVLVAGGVAAVFRAGERTPGANVRYLGRIGDDDLAFLLANAFCLAFPSRAEGFGLPILEAMVWGCPVIASRAASLPEVGGDACLYAGAEDGAAWLAQVDRLAAESGLAQTLRARGRERTKRFSWSRSAEVYFELMTAGGKSAAHNTRTHLRPSVCQAAPRATPKADSAAKITVVFATTGRAATLRRNLDLLARQTRLPDRVIVSAASQADVFGLEPSPSLDLIFGEAGLARQRNRALARMPADTRIVVFFDDDFVPHHDWLDIVDRYFADHPSVVALTGHLAVDGIKGPGLSFEEGLAAIEGCAQSVEAYCIDRYSPYGCNMAFRAAAIDGLSFDERLVLYSWLEDRDFGGALARRGGRLVKIGTAIGAHLGVKSGRMSGRKLGYSQVVNPVYLHRKGTMTTGSLCEHLARNLVANASRCLVPEGHIDRAGRFAGNLRGILDVMTGCASPERAETL